MHRALIIVLVGIACSHGRARTPEEVAVARLTEAISSQAEFTEADLYAALDKAGIPAPAADRAFKFTQIAWGRVFLGRLGNLAFAPDYLCFNGAGDIIESGLLSDQPYFIAAMASVADNAASAGFSRFALMSADVQAISKALAGGSKPEDLDVAPPALFLEPPTPAGLEKAQRLLSARVTPPAKK